MEPKTNSYHNDAENAPTKGVSELKAMLAAAGVFKGHHGLVGLLNADEFWFEQPYGTRLYYGDGVADYLHRDVLRAAVKLLAANKVI